MTDKNLVLSPDCLLVEEFIIRYCTCLEILNTIGDLVSTEYALYQKQRSAIKCLVIGRRVFISSSDTT